MTEKVGAIEYEIIADTGDLLVKAKDVDKAVDRMGDSFKQLDTQVTKSARGVKSGISSMSGSMGQAGIQVQQFVGQIQGGTNAMTALAQQGADLGIVLGAPLVGVVVSLAAVLVGTLAPSLFDSSEATDELVEKLKELKKETLLTEAQAKVLIKAEEDTIKSTKELIKEKQNEIDKTRALIKQNEDLREEYDKNARGGKYRQDVLDKYTEGVVRNTDKLNQQVSELELLNETLNQSSRNIETYSAVTEGASTQTDNQKKSIDEMVSSLEFQAQTYGKTAREIALYKAGIEGASASQVSAINAVFDDIDAKQAEIDATKALDAEFRNLAKSIDQEAAARKRKSDQEKASARSFVESTISSGMSEADRLAVDLQKIEDLRQQDLINEQMYQDAKTAIVEQQSEIRRNKELKQASDYADAQNDINSAIIQGLNNLTSNITSNLDEQSTAYKVAFAVQKAAAVAQAIVSAELAAANILARDVGIFGLGAVASSNIVKGLGYASAGIIAGTAISGGRQYGGPTSAGSIYEIGEMNRPEVLTEDGKSYLMAGNRGNVTPLDSMSSSVSVTNQIITPPGYTAEVSTQQQGQDVQQVISIVESQVNNPGSRTNQGIRKNNSTSPRLGFGSNGRR